MTRRIFLSAVCYLLFVPVAQDFSPASVLAQTLDRAKQPPIGKIPELRVPTWTKSKLSNGAELIVSEKHDLPLVSFSITFLGGTDQFETADRRGVGNLAAAMMSEGTKTRNGDDLSNALQLLGTNVSVGVAGESGSISFVSTSARFAQTLDILADMLVNSTFPPEALERLRAQRLVALEQAKAQPGSIASRVFPRVLYGDAHPLGQSSTERTIKAITRADVVDFHQRYFKPGRALITVVGDVTPAAVRPVIEKGLASWAPGGERPTFSFPSLPPAKPTTIYLVDKPGAAQSTFSLGLPGPARTTPDYYALQVMNTILGGMFQARLNANIREEKGYSYGVSSGFGFGKGPNPFRTGGDIVGDKSDAALVEFMKELRGILGERPVTEEEMNTAKESMVQRLPGTFASVTAINGAIAGLWLQSLPDNYYQQYTKSVMSVTAADVVRVAKQYLDLGHLAIVIVGDRKAIEEPLRATKIAPITLLDIEGNPTN
ncbi:MAG TPA: pitrilysin family protein [Vicinamibacterales bacterium]|nr:pitrilysin family protein [Vicinamibacterales bacterium]